SGMVLYVSSSVGCLFFSSRRRHTSFSRDWSSDVCSSDLPEPTGAGTLDSTSRVSPTLTLDFTLISLTTEVVGWDGLPAAAPEAGGRSLVSEGCRVTVPAMGTSPAAAAAQPSTAAPVADHLPGVEPGPGRLRLSFSRVDTYRTCPLKFRFAYVD